MNRKLYLTLIAILLLSSCKVVDQIERLEGDNIIAVPMEKLNVEIDMLRKTMLKGN